MYYFELRIFSPDLLVAYDLHPSRDMAPSQPCLLLCGQGLSRHPARAWPSFDVRLSGLVVSFDGTCVIN